MLECVHAARSSYTPTSIATVNSWISWVVQRMPWTKTIQHSYTILMWWQIFDFRLLTIKRAIFVHVTTEIYIYADRKPAREKKNAHRNAHAILPFSIFLSIGKRIFCTDATISNIAQMLTNTFLFSSKNFNKIGLQSMQKWNDSMVPVRLRAAAHTCRDGFETSSLNCVHGFRCASNFQAHRIYVKAQYARS